MAVSVAVLPVIAASCSDEDPILQGSGISEAEWAQINDVDLKGELVVYEFEASSSWQAISSDEWAQLLTPSGSAGLSSLRVEVAPNDGIEGRLATITIQSEGYSEPEIITLRQGEGTLEKGDGRYRDINSWIYDFMESHYLWNENIPQLKLDFSLDYQKFLTSMLDGIAAIDNANAEDGVWENGVHTSYFSEISSNAPISRTAGDRLLGSGLSIIPSMMDGVDKKTYLGFAVRWVTPGSPADAEGLKRGDFITKVNNIAVTEQNYQNLGGMVLNGNCTVDINEVEFNQNGAVTVTPKNSVMIGKDYYMDPSIYTSKIITTKSGKKVAYLNYMGFNMNYDDELIDAFAAFKSAGVTDLIVDLRFNIGGHVLSSTVMGTLIAGAAHEGEIYVRTSYNSARTAAGEVGEYRIGKPGNPEQYAGYDKITDALSQSLGLKNVYLIVSGYTASASELVINGLRGLDINVNLIGTTTLGKNVGMEGQRKTWHNYTFDFYPITFYCENAKGFRDYSDGFNPDVEFDDSNYYPFDFGTTEDALSRLALQWVDSGSKPNSRAAASGFSAVNKITVLPMTPELEAPMINRLGGCIQLRD